MQAHLDTLLDMDGWTLLEVAKGSVERAFWRLIMPSVNGLKGIGEVITRCVVLIEIVPVG